MLGLEKRNHGNEKMEMGAQRAVSGRGTVAPCVVQLVAPR